MNLIEAFMERNDLKAELKELKNTLNSKAYTEKDIQEKIDLTPQIEKYMQLQAKLTLLNISIYKANVAVIPVLKQIEGTTEVIATLKDLKMVLMNNPVKSRNSYKRLETDPSFLEKEHSVEISYLDDLINGLAKLKRTLEKELSSLNGKTNVEM